MRTTIHDIARHLGVAHSTVSRVLRNNSSISEATRQRVLQAAKELGYQPNRTARALVTGKTYMIALWLEIPHRPVYAQYYRYFQNKVEADEHKIVVSKYPVLPGKQTVKNLREWPEDGLIVVQDGNLLDLTEYQGCHPVVSIGGYDASGVDCVYLDMTGAQAQVMEHLLSQGCRRIACLFQIHDNIEACSRSRIYKEYMEKSGLEPEFIFTKGYSSEDAAEALPEYLDAHGCPEAIFCFNDEMAIATYSALYDKGYKIPDDVLIVGCDGIKMGEYARPKLTSICINLEEACQTAWDFLKKRIENPDIPIQHAVIKASLRIGDSSIKKQ